MGPIETKLTGLINKRFNKGRSLPVITSHFPAIAYMPLANTCDVILPYVPLF